MPTYEYVCRSCGHLFEIVQSMKDEPLTECPECGGVLRKVFAPPAIAFKGSGFYATDHGKKSKEPSESKPSERKGVKDGAAKPSDAGEAGGDTGASRAASGRGSAGSGSGGAGSDAPSAPTRDGSS